MKKIMHLFYLSFSTFVLYSQSEIKTTEVKVTYTNGLEVFNICTVNPEINFDSKKEYYWYTEFSKISSNEGGTGGNLLHGKYKFYDEYGNLLQEKNYYLGLLDGNEKNWNSNGNLVSQKKYDKGENVYEKFIDDANFWIEYTGSWGTEGAIKKVYTLFNSLIFEATMISDFKCHVLTYYDHSGNIKEDYFLDGIGPGDIFVKFRFGKYTTYYENGKIQIEGQFYGGKFTNIKDGIWKYYNYDGTLDATEEYKVEVEKWPNGELKVAGGYFFDNESKTWLKTGEWYWRTEDGLYQDGKIYDLGVEVTE
jgi:antitoxin component YwqK of YwqJK toxin-antitoxin module